MKQQGLNRDMLRYMYEDGADSLFNKGKLNPIEERILMDNISDLVRFKETGSVMKGGIITEYGINVAGAGDIVSSTVIKELIQTFNRVKDETIIMIMEKNV